MSEAAQLELLCVGLVFLLVGTNILWFVLWAWNHKEPDKPEIRFVKQDRIEPWLR
jgi:hypothetical protein